MKIIVDIDPADIDWGKSTVHQFAERGPDDAVYWDVDVDLDHCHWNGMRVEFADDDEACQWFHEQYKENAA
jgi:hypothetical protein